MKRPIIRGILWASLVFAALPLNAQSGFNDFLEIDSAGFYRTGGGIMNARDARFWSALESCVVFEDCEIPLELAPVADRGSAIAYRYTHSGEKFSFYISGEGAGTEPRLASRLHYDIDAGYTSGVDLSFRSYSQGASEIGFKYSLAPRLELIGGIFGDVASQTGEGYAEVFPQPNVAAPVSFAGFAGESFVESSGGTFAGFRFVWRIADDTESRGLTVDGAEEDTGPLYEFETWLYGFNLFGQATDDLFAIGQGGRNSSNDLRIHFESFQHSTRATGGILEIALKRKIGEGTYFKIFWEGLAAQIVYYDGTYVEFSTLPDGNDYDFEFLPQPVELVEFETIHLYGIGVEFRF